MSVIVSTTGRTQSRWQSVFARPSESIQSYLVAGEEVYHVDEPALNAFFIDELPLILFMIAVTIAAVVWGINTNNLFVAGIAMICVGIVLLYLRAKRWSQQYTAYILTNMRVMRVSGFFHRSTAWIPWVKVTDIRFEASMMGRIMGYATVFIDSANETSGLHEMKNLCDPRGFYIKLTELVQLKQGPMPQAQGVQLHD